MVGMIRKPDENLLIWYESKLYKYECAGASTSENEDDDEN